MTTITDDQMRVLCHTLGLDNGAAPERRKPYRNHFIAGGGSVDLPHILAMIDLGLMEERRRPSFIDETWRHFAATDEGRSVAVAHVEARWAEVPRGKKRYLIWLRSELPCSFGEFLRRGWYDEERFMRDYR